MNDVPMYHPCLSMPRAWCEAVLEKLQEGDIVPLATDGTFRVTFGQYVLQVIGLLHLVQTVGKVRGGQGGKGSVVLPRVSFAPLAFSLLESENTDACVQFTGWYGQWLRIAYPSAYEKLLSCSLTVSDFRESGERCLRILCANPATHKHCFQHLKRNATMIGYTGYREKMKKHRLAPTLRSYLVLLQQAWNPVVFDMLARQLLLKVRFEHDESDPCRAMFESFSGYPRSAEMQYMPAA